MALPLTHSGSGPSSGSPVKNFAAMQPPRQASYAEQRVQAPPASVRLGVRRLVVAGFATSAVFQVLPGAIFAQGPLLVAGFLLGITAQSIKLCVDTLVQAHVDDEFKGRVFVLYDMLFNVALVAAAAIGALILPADGVSVPIIVGLAIAYALLGLGFALASRQLSMNEGTESLRGPQSGPGRRSSNTGAA